MRQNLNEGSSRAALYALVCLLLTAVSCDLGSNPDTPWNGEPVVDVDGNEYPTVKIGKQVWMAENLRTTSLRDGTPIALVPDNTAWCQLSTPAFCWFNNDTANRGEYGALYNWYTASSGQLAPAGWHVPTDAEWTTLIAYLGGENVAGGKLKEAGTNHWASPNTGATNSSGFAALPGGQRNALGAFRDANYTGHWHSASAKDAQNFWGFGLANSNTVVYRSGGDNRCAASVRCIKD